MFHLHSIVRGHHSVAMVRISGKGWKLDSDVLNSKRLLQNRASYSMVDY